MQSALLAVLPLLWWFLIADALTVRLMFTPHCDLALRSAESDGAAPTTDLRCLRTATDASRRLHGSDQRYLIVVACDLRTHDLIRHERDPILNQFLFENDAKCFLGCIAAPAVVSYSILIQNQCKVLS